MASLNSKKVHQNITKKGFEKVNGHHNFFEFYHDGKLIASTKTSHNGQDLTDYLISAMSRQCKMRKDFFIEFAKCTKSKSDYIQELKDQGLL